MSKPYHSLATREYEGASWGVQFGDYSRGCVSYEMQDYREQGYERKDLRIITTGDSQEEIDAAIAKLNGEA